MLPRRLRGHLPQRPGGSRACWIFPSCWLLRYDPVNKLGQMIHRRNTGAEGSRLQGCDGLRARHYLREAFIKQPGGGLQLSSAPGFILAHFA